MTCAYEDEHCSCAGRDLSSYWDDDYNSPLTAGVIPLKSIGPKPRKGHGSITHKPPLKKRRVDTSPAAVVDREASASGVALPLVSGLLRDEAYASTKSKASELSLLFDRLVGDYDEDVRFRDSELRVAKEANTALQLRLDELTERNLVIEPMLLLIGEAVAAARGEMTRGFAGRVSEVAGLLAEIGGKVQNNMLNLAEIDADLEFIRLLRGSSPPDLPTEIRALHERRRTIYYARDVFGEFLDKVREVLEIPEVSAADEVDDEVNDDDEADD
ncbi:hypothetical protein AALP_AA4G208900 [Arabis alpina]|uniref:Uncharacterized protein n=1 Tax=Arabis alpina TaxID=50452 RepID=A0A087H4M0_ARAAL|nr:hypothetical protein AALP_AA4G208900 [Arabis alpina]